MLPSRPSNRNKEGRREGGKGSEGMGEKKREGRKGNEEVRGEKGKRKIDSKKNAL